MTKDLISRQAAISLAGDLQIHGDEYHMYNQAINNYCTEIMGLPSAQLERLTDDDFETIRIHLNAFKERLCNQRRWKEAEEYEKLINRFISFASAQLERPKGEWIPHKSIFGGLDEKVYTCNQCGCNIGFHIENFCPRCGSYNGGKEDEID